MPKTVKVRIAVAVDPEGAFCAAGWAGPDGVAIGKEAMDVATDGVESGEARYWLEVELPVPEPVTVTEGIEVSDG
jgi:hypothetical protein